MLTDNLLWFGGLLLLAAALGWLLARAGSSSGSGRPRGRPFNLDYFRGLNFLLNEQPDKAIEVFVRMVEVDSDTVETHFALGSLFRRRGEVDRAIRIHQNLIARPTLNKLHRSHALYELGEDYMKAGLFDRAESLFLELAHDRPYMEAALRNLVVIYEQQKDWEQAVTTARELQAASGISRHEQIAQYYCELASVAVERGETRLAIKQLKRAQGFDRNSVRVALLQASLAEREHDLQGAIRHYKRALQLDLEFALEVLPALVRLAQQTKGQSDLQEYLESLRRRNPLAVTQIALAAIIHPGIQGTAVQACVDEFIRTSNDLRGLYELLELLDDSGRGWRNMAREQVVAVLRRLLESGPRYKCRECGFTAKTLYWQCPSCKTWNSTHPHLDVSLRGVAHGSDTATDSGQFHALPGK